jgi:WD40 repeat protein
VLTVAALVASALTVFAFNEQGRAAREASRAQEEASRAEREGRLATARELAAAATANLTVDPERSLLLALQALETTRQDATVLPEAVQTLHDAIAADRLLFTMEHPSTANVEWSPDGRLLATGGSAAGKDQTDVLLWDAKTGAKLRTLSGHTTDIDELAFSPDSSRLVTNSHDGQMIVWDTRTGERVLTMPAGTGLGANFSPDGRRLVVGGSAPSHVTAEVVDARTGEVLKTLVTADNVGLPVYSPDGTLIAVPRYDDVSFFDAETGREVRTFPVDGSFAVLYSPDGTKILAQLGSGAAVLDALTGDVLFRIPGSPVGIDWSADGRLIATGDNDGTARIWDAATGEELLRLAGHRGGVALVSFSPDGTRLLTGGTDGTARVWDITPTATAEWLGAHEAPGRDSVAFSPDGRSLVTGGWCRGWLWDTTTRARRRAIPEACGPAAFGPQGATIARVTCMDFSCEVGRIKILDAATGEELQGIDHIKGWPGSVEFSADGSMIATAGSDPTVWDASSGKAVVDGLVNPGEAINDVALSPDGTALAGITELATLYLWEIPSGKELLHMQAQSGFGAAVAFASDGSKLATTGADGATVWSRSGERLASVTGAGRLSSVTFSADGKRVATGGADGTARIWDATTGEQLLVLKGHTGPVNDVAFSPDGTRLATVSEGTLRVYVLPVDELVGIARARLSRTLSDEECRQYLHVQVCPPPTSPTPSPPPQPATPPAGGPEGAYRVAIAAGGLPSPLSEAQEWYAGHYTLSLVDGIWRLHVDRTLLPRSDGNFNDEWSGPYTVSGDRIVLSVESGGDPGCLGSEIAGRWATGPSAISFEAMAWAANDSCVSFQLGGDVRQTNDAWLRTIFESRPWIRVP